VYEGAGKEGARAPVAPDFRKRPQAHQGNQGLGANQQRGEFVVGKEKKMFSSNQNYLKLNNGGEYCIGKDGIKRKEQLTSTNGG